MGHSLGVERVQWWVVRRPTAVYVPFSVHTMAWLEEYRAFIVEEFIKYGGSPLFVKLIQWTLELRPAWHTNNLGYEQNYFCFDLRPKS
jgi:hypothetical protein